MGYDMLRSKPSKKETVFDILGVNFNEVASLPLSYLKLAPSVNKIFINREKTKNGYTLPKFKNLGELINFGFLPLKNYLYDFLSAEDARDALQEVQEELARFALKLKNTEFTIFDIRIDNMGLNQNEYKWAVSKNLKTLGDLYIYGEKRLKAELENVPKVEYSKIESKLWNYGTLPEIDDRRKKLNYKMEMKKIFPSIKEAIEDLKNHPEAYAEVQSQKAQKLQEEVGKSHAQEGAASFENKKSVSQREEVTEAKQPNDSERALNRGEGDIAEQNQALDETETGGAGKAGKQPKDNKFYMGQSGYTIVGERVKKHNFFTGLSRATLEESLEREF